MNFSPGDIEVFTPGDAGLGRRRAGLPAAEIFWLPVAGGAKSCAVAPVLLPYFLIFVTDR